MFRLKWKNRNDVPVFLLAYVINHSYNSLNLQTLVVLTII